MSDEQSTQTAGTGAQINADGQSVPPEGTDTGERENGPQNREARYRVERNEARQERDALASRLESLQTAELHRLAGDLLAAPEDLALSGKALQDFLTPEGWVDREAVAEAAADLVKSRPGLAKNPKFPAVDSTQGMGGSLGKPQPSWDALFA